MVKSEKNLRLCKSFFNYISGEGTLLEEIYLQFDKGIMNIYVKMGNLQLIYNINEYPLTTHYDKKIAIDRINLLYALIAKTIVQNLLFNKMEIPMNYYRYEGHDIKGPALENFEWPETETVQVCDGSHYITYNKNKLTELIYHFMINKYTYDVYYKESGKYSGLHYLTEMLLYGTLLTRSDEDFKEYFDSVQYDATFLGSISPQLYLKIFEIYKDTLKK